MEGFETYRKGDGKLFSHTFILVYLKYLFPTVTNTFYNYFCTAFFQKAEVLGLHSVDSLIYRFFFPWISVEFNSHLALTIIFHSPIHGLSYTKVDCLSERHLIKLNSSF